MNRRRLPVLVLIASAAALAFVCRAPAPPAIDWSRDAVVQVDGGASAMAAEPRGGEHRAAAGPDLAAAGCELRYAMRLEVEMELTGKAEAAPRGEVRPLALTGEGELVVTPLARRAGEVVLGYRLPGLALCVAGETGGRTAEWGRAIASGLAAGFAVRTDERGRILGYRFPRAMTPDQRNWARSIAAAFAFTRSAEPGAAEWSCDEEDSLGRWSVAYRRLADGSVERRRTRLVPHGAVAGEGARVEGAARAELDAERGCVVRAEVDESVRFAMAGLAVEVRSASRGTLRLLRIAPAAAAAFAWDGDWAPVSGHEERSAVVEEQMAEQRRQALEGRSLQDLVARLRAVVATAPQGLPEFHDTLRLLADLIELRPGTAQAILAMLEQFAVRDEVAAALVVALGMAGGAEAQSALSTVFADVRHGDDLREAAVQSMFQVGKPGDELVGSLRRALQGSRVDALGASTMLALGALSARRDDGGELVAELLAKESAARSSGAARAFFEALGNSGDPRVLAVARRGLASADQDERALALSAIRRVDDPAARALLQHHATQDAAPAVRAHAVDLIGEGRDPRQTAILVERAKSDPDAGVRGAAIRALSARLRTEAGVRDQLGAVVKGERDPDLLVLLRQVLG